MKIGMLWYDTQGTLRERLNRAQLHYQNKYGVEANCVYLPPEEALTKNINLVDGISPRS